MEPLNPATDGASANIVGENLAKLRELFPDAFTESSVKGEPRWKVDFDALREVLGDTIEDKPERYSFTWNGKSRAKLIANTPTAATLRPCPEESVNWDTTKNLFIEGDNLEVLKLLQKSYHRKVKMIYIDPPYNTGKEFIYPDKFQDNLGTYLRYTGQIDDDGFKLSSNAESSGRYHTNWLNMMLPRLKLARNLLRDDGAIFVSIDDNEVVNVRKLCDEVFGEENFVAQLVWAKRVSPANDAKWYSSDHEYVVIYARVKEQWYPRKTERTEQHNSYYKNPDNDPRGAWNSAAYTCNKSRSERPNLYYSITNPNTGDEVWPDENAVWKYSKERHEQNVKENRLYWGANGQSSAPRSKAYLDEAKPVVPRSLLHHKEVGSTQTATLETRELFEGAAFTYPKSVGLIKKLLFQTLEDGDTVLDFFAGSCTTAHAVFELNAEQEASHRFIMVQLPEECSEDSESFKAGYATIAEIGKERIRRAAQKFADLYPSDLGFKVFKLDASSVTPWDTEFEAVEEKLYDNIDRIKSGRTDSDLMYELLLKYGLERTDHIPSAFGACSGLRDSGVGGSLSVSFFGGHRWREPTRKNFEIVCSLLTTAA